MSIKNKFPANSTTLNKISKANIVDWKMKLNTIFFEK